MEPEGRLGSSVLTELDYYNGLLKRWAKGSCPQGLRAEGKSLIFREMEIIGRGRREQEVPTVLIAQEDMIRAVMMSCGC